MIKEKLRFPSGTATAQLIGIMHNVKLRADEKATPEASDETNDAGETRPLLWQRSAQGAFPHGLQGSDALDSANEVGRAESGRIASAPREEPDSSLEIEESWRPMWYSFCVSASITVSAQQSLVWWIRMRAKLTGAWRATMTTAPSLLHSSAVRSTHL